MIKSGLRPTAQLRIATVLPRKTDRRDAPFAAYRESLKNKDKENIEIKETEINEEVSEKPIKIRKRNYKKSSNVDEEIIENELENNETE